jgi:hypothetical protein
MMAKLRAMLAPQPNRAKIPMFMASEAERAGDHKQEKRDVAQGDDEEALEQPNPRGFQEDERQQVFRPAWPTASGTWVHVFLGPYF